MHYTVIEASKIVGKSRQTIYRHIASKPITVTLDDDKNQLIEASELMRVYGNDINFDVLEEENLENDTVSKEKNVTPVRQVVTSDPSEKTKIIELTSKIEGLKALISDKEDQNEFLKKLLEEEKAERKAANNLLEDHRGKETKWDEQFRALEMRLANQEKEAKEREEARISAIIKEQEEQRLKEEAENKKGFFKKLFG